jgi:uncharacterized membrane protein
VQALVLVAVLVVVVLLVVALELLGRVTVAALAREPIHKHRAVLEAEANNITGSSVAYAGGGGGGGSGGNYQGGFSNAPNLGGGGTNGPGGSGVVIIRYPDSFDDAVPSAGLVWEKTTIGGNKIFKFTSGSGTVSW